MPSSAQQLDHLHHPMRSAYRANILFFGNLFVFLLFSPNLVSTLNTQYMTSGLEKTFLKFLHVLTMSFLLLNFDQKYKFSNKKNMVSAWRNFKNIFPRPLFIRNFRPEMLKFHPYSILTGDTRVEFVVYSLLMTFMCPSPKLT